MATDARITVFIHKKKLGSLVFLGFSCTEELIFSLKNMHLLSDSCMTFFVPLRVLHSANGL